MWSSATALICPASNKGSLILEKPVIKGSRKEHPAELPLMANNGQASKPVCHWWNSHLGRHGWRMVIPLLPKLLPEASSENWFIILVDSERVQNLKKSHGCTYTYIQITYFKYFFYIKRHIWGIHVLEYIESEIK